MPRDKVDQLGEAFIERTTHAFGIPDEVTDSKRSKVFALIPGSQSRDRSIAFVLPDLLANALRVGFR
jgi:hypothetical protein